MLFVGEDFDHFKVATNPAAILRGAGVRAGETNGMFALGIGRQNLLDEYLVLPAVAEIVLINKIAFHRRSHFSDGVAFLADGLPAKIHHVRVGSAVESVADDELVQMTVGPTHYSLDDAVQSIERHVRANNNTAPDRRLRTLQRDLQLIKRNGISR